MDDVSPDIPMFFIILLVRFTTIYEVAYISNRNVNKSIQAVSRCCVLLKIVVHEFPIPVKNIGAFGIFCSVFSLYTLYKTPTFHSAFGLICTAHSLSEAGILCCFVFWAAPIIFFDKAIGLSSTGIVFGTIINYLYYTSLYFQFVKSFNRFCAIIFSVHYWHLFTIRNAKILIIIVAIVSVLHVGPFLMYDCNFYFNTDAYTWAVREDSCATGIALYIDMGSGTVTMTIGLICDSVTFCYLRLMRKKMQQKKAHLGTKEIKFFFQTCLTTFLYGGMLVSFHIVSHHTTELWTTFAATTLAWELCHSLNQFFFVLFNFKPEKPKIIQIVSSAVSTPKTFRTTSWMAQ